MTHSIDYQIGAQLCVPPLMHGGEYSEIMVTQVGAEYATVVLKSAIGTDGADKNTFQVDMRTHKLTRGYHQVIYSTIEQHHTVTKQHREFIQNIKILNDVVWCDLSSQQICDVLAIACPEANERKPDQIIWHERPPEQLAQIVAIIDPVAVA